MRRFPLGLTAAFLVAFLLVAGLGVWQLQRLAWKQDLLRRIDALRAAPARPLAEALAGGDAAYQRVFSQCAPPAPAAPVAYRYAMRDGAVAWRLLTVCRVSADGFDGILLDRGLVTRFAGAMSPAMAVFPAPVSVVGVLRSLGDKPLLGAGETPETPQFRVFRVIDSAAAMALARQSGLTRPAPYLLAVESETPATPGVAPAALPQDIPNNHFVYALTWFALAGILAWFYGALLLGRLRGR